MRHARRAAAILLGLAVGAGAFPGCTGSPGGEPPPPPPLSPDGLFANTLIRGHPPESPYAGNTVAALRDANTYGYQWIEVDVRLSADGVFIPARHDPLEKATDCTGSLAAMTVAELAPCNNDRDGAVTPVRPLADALVDANFLGVFLDLKSTSTEPYSTPEEIVAGVALLASQVNDPTSLVAMSYDVATAVALLDAGFRTGLKAYPADAAAVTGLVDQTAAIGGEMFCVHITVLDEPTLLHAADVGVWNLPWAGGPEITRDSMELLVSTGAGGIISGNPEDVTRLYDQAFGG